MSSLLIIGAGGHGKVVADIADLMENWDTISFLDDREEIKEVNGFPVIGGIEGLSYYKNRYKDAFVAIGNNQKRLNLIQLLANNGFNIPTIIHPSSVISRFSRVGEGSVVMAGSVINAGTNIGTGCIINTCSSVDHDCLLGDGVHISPGTNISGTVRIGQCSWACVGSKVINNITIGSNAIIAAGAIVISDVPDNVMVAGVPAHIKKRLGDDL